METVYLALRVLLSLGVVLGLLWFMHRRLTRGGRLTRTAKPVTVVARQAIGPKASVVVVDVDGQRLLLGVTEQSVTVLTTGDAPAQAEIEAAAPHLKAVESAGRQPRHRLAEPEGGASFARVLADAGGPATSRATGSASAPHEIAYLGQANGTTGALGGSILSPTTWKRTASALRRIR